MKIPKLPEIKLPTWMDEEEPLTLAHASARYWEKVYGWLTWPLAQIDVDTCAEPLLNLLAYQRNITRFKGESLPLFRLRVKHAFINAQDAGERAGFEKIFKRLEIGEVQTLERQLAYDWDVILLRINDEQLSRNNTLMMQLVRQYGRTCRRYFFDVLTRPESINLRPMTFDNDARLYAARLIVSAKGIATVPTSLAIAPGESKKIQVSVLPEDAENKAFHVKITDNAIATVTRAGDTLTLTGGDLGGTVLSVVTDDGGHEATVAITVRIPDVVRVKIRYAPSLMPLFYVSQEELSGDFTLDYGDGIDGKQYRINTQGAVYSTRSIHPGTEFTLVIKGCESCRFYGANKINDVLEVIRVSGMRTTIDGMFQNCHVLHTVHTDAFSQCPNVTDASYLFAYCYALKHLPSKFFNGMPNITTLNSALRSCKALAALPDGLFASLRAVKSFSYALYGCVSLATLPSDLFLGAHAATDFTSVFGLCTALTDLPDRLFARCVSARTFATAFANCTSLQTLGFGVFSGCQSAGDFSHVFAGCSNLPRIPGSTFEGCIAAEKFDGVFERCAKLQTLEEGLFSACVSANTFTKAFYLCSMLTHIPSGLFDSARSSAYSFREAFYGCSSLQVIPDKLFAEMQNNVNFNQTFRECASLQATPAALFAGGGSSTYDYTFHSCTSLGVIGNDIFSGCAKANDFTSTFYQCSALKNIPEGMFDDCRSATLFRSTFEGCRSLSALPGGLFSGLERVTHFSDTFAECSALTDIPPRLFEGCRSVQWFLGTFKNCASLVVLPDGLFDDCITATLFQEVFKGCSALTAVPAGCFDALPLADYFDSAFYGCTSLHSDINDIFPQNHYPKIRSLGAIFRDCTVLSGEGRAFIAKISSKTNHSGALRNCRQLRDYNEMPSDWR